jgi:uncharacterized protein (DUF924 family)
MELRPGVADEILSFWFGDSASFDTESSIIERINGVWFAGSDEVDDELRVRFKDDLESVTEETLRSLASMEEKLAVVVLLDQCSRNIYRDAPNAFAQDHLALNLAKAMIHANEDKDLEPIQRVFVYMPLEHSEDEEDQELSVRKFEELYEEAGDGLKKVYKGFLDYAIRHKVIIDRFGRFPHRNEILGRTSTSEEIEFLKQPGSSF